MFVFLFLFFIIIAGRNKCPYTPQLCKEHIGNVATVLFPSAQARVGNSWPRSDLLEDAPLSGPFADCDVQAGQEACVILISH